MSLAANVGGGGRGKVKPPHSHHCPRHASTPIATPHTTPQCNCHQKTQQAFRLLDSRDGKLDGKIEGFASAAAAFTRRASSGNERHIQIWHFPHYPRPLTESLFPPACALSPLLSPSLLSHNSPLSSTTGESPQSKAYLQAQLRRKSSRLLIPPSSASTVHEEEHEGVHGDDGGDVSASGGASSEAGGVSPQRA